MFLISEKGKVLNTDLSDLADFTLRMTYTPLAMYAPSVVVVVRVVVNPHSSHGEMHLVMPTLPYSPTHLKETDLNRAVSLCILLLFCAFLQEKRGYPTPENAILHPILHPKSPINTGRLGHGCRKCRIFSKTFFSGRRKAVLCKTKTQMDIPTS